MTSQALSLLLTSGGLVSAATGALAVAAYKAPARSVDRHVYGACTVAFAFLLVLTAFVAAGG